MQGISTVSSWTQRRPVLAFVLLAYSFSWALWVPASFFTDGNPRTLLMLIMAGGWGPALAAIAVARLRSHGADPAADVGPRLRLFALAGVLGLLVAIGAFASGGARSLRAGGAEPVSFSGVPLVSLLLAVLAFAFVTSRVFSPDDGVRSLMKGLVRWRVPPIYFAVAFLLLPLIWWLGAGMAVSLGAPVREPAVVSHPLLYWLPLFLINFVFIAIFTGGVCEEVGWRGLMQNELQMRYSPLTAAVLVGIAWSFWHAPLHLFGFYPGGAMGILTRLPPVVLLAIVFAWLYNRTGGSILLVILLHTTNNSLGWIAPGTIYVLIPSMLAIVGMVLVDRMYRPLRQPVGESTLVPIRPGSVGT
jgi:uncharacterized protein